VRCVYPSQHSSNDRHPSLIIWMHKNRRTGSAMCMVCKSRTTPNANLSFHVQFHGNNAWLFERDLRLRSPGAEQKTLSSRDSPLGGNGVGGKKRASTKFRAALNPRARRKKTAGNTGLRASEKGELAKSLKSGYSRDHPVGGRVASASVSCGIRGGDDGIGAVSARKTRRDYSKNVAASYVGAMLKETAQTERMAATALVRTVGSALVGDPLELMVKSERLSKSAGRVRHAKSSEQYAQELQGAEDANGDDDDNKGKRGRSRMWIPMNVLSVSRMRASSFRELSGVFIPASWASHRQEWVLFDLDSTKHTDVVAKPIATGLVSVVRRNQELSGRCMVIRTGPQGFHVWAELREPRVTPSRWFGNKAVREWYQRTGCRLLAAAHRRGAIGGHLDLSSCAAGRFGRRPGWRILSDGTAFRSELIAIAASRVPSRVPRACEQPENSELDDSEQEQLSLT